METKIKDMMQRNKNKGSRIWCMEKRNQWSDATKQEQRVKDHVSNARWGESRIRCNKTRIKDQGPRILCKRIKGHSRHLLLSSSAGQQVDHWQPEQNNNKNNENSWCINNNDNTNKKNNYQINSVIMQWGFLLSDSAFDFEHRRPCQIYQFFDKISIINQFWFPNHWCCITETAFWGKLKGNQFF